MRFFCLSVVLLILVKCFASQFKQEGATVTKCNYKYVTECYAITRRLKRGEPYKTNLTAVSRYPLGNNVTIKVVMYSDLPVELVKTKLCEISKIKWLWDYSQTYTKYQLNLSINDECPYKPGLYGFYNLVFPPKNLPHTILNLLKGNFHAKFTFLVTKTEEIILECSIKFYSLV